MNIKWITLVLAAFLSAARAAMELPKFKQMILLYPGYYLHGGKYRDKEIIEAIGGNVRTNTHNTAALRMSYTLNKFGGQHTIGTAPIFLSKKGRDSYTGHDGLEYIYRNTAFGPFLADHYGNPQVAKPNKHDHTRTMLPFKGKQGIVRLVSFHRGRHSAGGHVGLWDCDHFYQSRDWTTETHIISVEFWEAPDSFCPAATVTPPPEPILQTPDPTNNLHIVLRHNFQKPDYWHDEPQPEKLRHHRRNHNQGHHTNQNTAIWLQR